MSKAYADNAAQAMAILPCQRVRDKEDEALSSYCGQWIAIAHIIIERKEEYKLEHSD
ncbi:MAG TPA: hypothetical protein VGE97_10220 [Nitrososphaera sp.]